MRITFILIASAAVSLASCGQNDRRATVDQNGTSYANSVTPVAEDEADSGTDEGSSEASDTVPEGQYEGTPVDGTPVNGAQADPALDPNSPPAPDADTSADDQSSDSGSDS